MFQSFCYFTWLACLWKWHVGWVILEKVDWWPSLPGGQILTLGAIWGPFHCHLLEDRYSQLMIHNSILEKECHAVTWPSTHQNRISSSLSPVWSFVPNLKKAPHGIRKNGTPQSPTYLDPRNFDLQNLISSSLGRNLFQIWRNSLEVLWRTGRANGQPENYEMPLKEHTYWRKLFANLLFCTAAVARTS